MATEPKKNTGRKKVAVKPPVKRKPSIIIPPDEIPETQQEYRAAPKIEMIKVSDLVPYEKNSRTHSTAQLVQVAASITEFGFTNPILIDNKNGIIAGHGRMVAAKSLNMETVPCVRLGHLTPAQQKAYVIADNRLGLDAGWASTYSRQRLTS